MGDGNCFDNFSNSQPAMTKDYGIHPIVIVLYLKTL